MNIYLKHLVTAFYLVDQKYYSNFAYSGNWRDVRDIKEKEYTQYIERVFAYELYHQFRNIMVKHPKDYNDLVFNGEIGKNGFNGIYKSSTMFPDLVLHRGQGIMENQKIFIEIKTSPNISAENLQNDINKLSIAVDDTLRYQNAVFICINIIYKQLIIKIKEELEDVDDKICSKIWLLTDSKGLVNFKEIKEN